MCVGAERGATLGPLRSRETACVLAASRAAPVRLACLRISADLLLSPLLPFAGLIAVGVVFSDAVLGGLVIRDAYAS